MRHSKQKRSCVATSHSLEPAGVLHFSYKNALEAEKRLDAQNKVSSERVGTHDGFMGVNTGADRQNMEQGGDLVIDGHPVIRLRSREFLPRRKTGNAKARFMLRSELPLPRVGKDQLKASTVKLAKVIPLIKSSRRFGRK